MQPVEGTQVKRGIFLVANLNSSDFCHNLIYSIRQCGCTLPIRVIPYGGRTIRLDPKKLTNTQLSSVNDFPVDGQAFVSELQRRMPTCSPGLLRRFLAWFGEFDEFIYSDNDVIALMNWEQMFQYLAEHELVHADHQFRAGARFNMHQPGAFEELLGPGALDLAVNAGHFLCRRSPHHLMDLLAALSWMEAHPGVAKWHDQALLNVTLAMSKWRVLNLCKPPYNWANSSAGYYGSMFDVLRTIQTGPHPMSHLHYAGYTPTGTRSVDELIFTSLTPDDRNYKLMWALAHKVGGLTEAQRLLRRARQEVRRKFQKPGKPK